MAINNLANYNSDKDGFGMSLNIRRGNPNPLDNSSVWSSLADAQEYAANDPTAYVGQILTVVTGTSGNYTSSVYVIDDAEGTLVEISAHNKFTTTYDSATNTVTFS